MARKDIITKGHSEDLAESLAELDVILYSEINNFWYLLQDRNGEKFYNNFVEYLCNSTDQNNFWVDLENLSVLISNILNKLNYEEYLSGRSLSEADRRFVVLVTRVDQILEIFLSGLEYKGEPSYFHQHSEAQAVFEAGENFNTQNKE